MFGIQQLRLVVAIADSGSLTKAAARLNLTQSALSHQLADLERKLGITLFLRTRKGMTVTQSGERLVTAARRLVAEIEELEESFRLGSADANVGIIRIATECYTCYHWLPRVISTFKKAWPRVEIRIEADATRGTLDALIAGEIDVGIVRGPSSDPKVRSTALFEDELLLIVSPEHRLARLPFVDPAELAHEHLLLYSSPHSPSDFVETILRPGHIEPRQLSWIQLTEAIIELVKADVGVGVLAEWAVRPHVDMGTVAAKPFVGAGLHRTWCAATRAGLAHPPYVQAFLELLTRDVFVRRVATAPLRLA